MKLFSNFTSIPFDYLLISWGKNYFRNRGFLTCLSGFNRVYREVQNFQNFSTKYLLESSLMCFFVCLGFLKRL